MNGNESNLNYGRCPNDDSARDEFAQIGMNPETEQPVELTLNGVASVLAIQSALLTISAALKSGHEKDFMEKAALCLSKKLSGDPHALCPLLSICAMSLLLLTGQTCIQFDEEGHVVISSPDSGAAAGPACMFDDRDEEGEDHGTDERGVDGTGTEEDGGGIEGGGEGIGPA